MPESAPQTTSQQTPTTKPNAPDTARAPRPAASGYRLILAGVLLVASYFSARWLGYLVGWLIGASNSPIAQAIAPLIFGLIAVIGVDVGVRGTLVSKSRPRRLYTVKSLYRAIFVAFVVTLFCRSCYYGVKMGILSRTGPYRSMCHLVGSSLKTADPQAVSALYAFQLKARRSNVSWQEFEPFISDVARRILEDDQPEKLERISQAIEQMEEAMRSAEENPQPGGIPTPQ